jgi:hypothetical protein
MLACFIIFNLYAALKHPLYFAKYHKKIRPYAYIFTIVYIGIFIFASLFEPIFRPYSDEEIANRHNCSSAYRYRLYQYLLTSPLISIPFSIFSVYCTFVIIHKITVTPKSSVKNQVMIRTKIPLSRWIYILFISIAITVLTMLNLLSDINNGLHPENEREKLGTLYYFTASTGIIIFLVSLSPSQIKYLFGVKSSNTFDYEEDEISKNEIKSNIISLYGDDIQFSRINNNSRGSIQSQHSNYSHRSSHSRHSSYSRQSNYSRHSRHSSHSRRPSHSRNLSQGSTKDSSFSFINTSYNSSSKLIKNDDPSFLNFNFPKEMDEVEDLSQFIININSYVYGSSPDNRLLNEQPNNNNYFSNNKSPDLYRKSPDLYRKSPDLYRKSPDSYYFPSIPNDSNLNYIRSLNHHSRKSSVEQKSSNNYSVETPNIAHVKKNTTRNNNYR